MQSIPQHLPCRSRSLILITQPIAAFADAVLCSDGCHSQWHLASGADAAVLLTQCGGTHTKVARVCRCTTPWASSREVSRYPFIHARHPFQSTSPPSCFNIGGLESGRSVRWWMDCVWRVRGAPGVRLGACLAKARMAVVVQVEGRSSAVQESFRGGYCIAFVPVLCKFVA